MFLGHFYSLFDSLIHTHTPRNNPQIKKGSGFPSAGCQLDVTFLCGWTIAGISDWLTLFFHIMTRWILSALRKTQNKSFPVFWDSNASASQSSFMGQPKTKLAAQVGPPLVFIYAEQSCDMWNCGQWCIYHSMWLMVHVLVAALDYQWHFTHFFFCLYSKISQRSGEENRTGGLWHHQSQ